MIYRCGCLTPGQTANLHRHSHISERLKEQGGAWAFFFQNIGDPFQWCFFVGLWTMFKSFIHEITRGKEVYALATSCNTALLPPNGSSTSFFQLLTFWKTAPAGDSDVTSKNTLYAWRSPQEDEGGWKTHMHQSPCVCPQVGLFLYCPSERRRILWNVKIKAGLHLLGLGGKSRSEKVSSPPGPSLLTSLSDRWFL